jgi:hypothetical protein
MTPMPPKVLAGRAGAIADAYCNISGWFLGAVFCYQASLLLFLSEGLELSAAQIGIVLGVEMCLQFALEVPSGLLTDEIGGGRTVRWALGCSILGSSLYLALYVAHQNWPWDLDQPVLLCVLCSFIVALGASLYSGALERWVDENGGRGATVHGQEQRAKSWMQMGKLLGGLAGFACLALADLEVYTQEWMFAGPWSASLLVQAGILVRYWRLLGTAPMTPRDDGAGLSYSGLVEGSLFSRLLDRARGSALWLLDPVQDREFLYRTSVHAVLSAAILVANIYFSVFLIDMFRADRTEDGVYILVAGAWAGTHLLGILGTLRARAPTDGQALVDRYFGHLAVFVLGFIGLAMAGNPQQTALFAGLLIFSVCRYLEGQSRVLQTAASRTLIGERWGQEEGAFLSLEAWVRSIVSAVTLLTVGVAGEFGGWSTFWAVSAAAVCVPSVLLWFVRRHALLSLLSWSIVMTTAALWVSTRRPSAEVVTLGQVDLDQRQGPELPEYGYLVTSDVGREGPGWLLLRSSEPLFGFHSLDEWLMFAGVRPSAELLYCDFVPGAIHDSYTCRYSVGPVADDEPRVESAQGGRATAIDPAALRAEPEFRRPQFVVMSYRKLEDFTGLALLWCAESGPGSCQSDRDFKEIEVHRGWVQHSTLPQGAIAFAALFGWLFALRMYFRGKSASVIHIQEVYGAHGPMGPRHGPASDVGARDDRRTSHRRFAIKRLPRLR